MFQLLEWVIMRNHSFAEVDDILTRYLMKVKSLSSKQLRKYISSMTPLVEQTVKQHLREKFGILFDGWSDSGVHYVAIFATYVKDNAYCETLLACAPLLDEGDLGAEQHLSFLEATLEVFDKTFANVVCLIGDNCSVNQKLSSISLLPLVGCVSHKFNLAVESWIESQPELKDGMKCVHDLMLRLRTIKNAARLRQFTHLRALLNNETRWTSKYEMLKRFFRIEDNVRKMEDLDIYLPTAAVRRHLVSAVQYCCLGHSKSCLHLAARVGGGVLGCAGSVRSGCIGPRPGDSRSVCCRVFNCWQRIRGTPVGRCRGVFG